MDVWLGGALKKALGSSLNVYDEQSIPETFAARVPNTDMDVPANIIDVSLVANIEQIVPHH